MAPVGAPSSDTAPDTAPDPDPASYPTLTSPPPALAAAATPTPFLVPTAEEQFEGAQNNWPSDILNHPHIKSRYNEMVLFVVCLLFTLSDGYDRKILLRYPFASIHWIQNVVISFQKHHFNVKIWIISSNIRANRNKTHPCYIYSKK